MANYRMTIQYDGTRYSGWQSQHATDATIQGKLETVLTRMTGQQVDVIGSGRTDAGVHAIGQVANFHLKQPRNTGELLDGLNRYLPEDIAVSSLTEVDERYFRKAKDNLYRELAIPLGITAEEVEGYIISKIDPEIGRN